MALSREAEDRLISAILMLTALPAMTAGIIVGVRSDDTAMVVGCTLIIVMLPYFFRSALQAAYERIPMFGRSKKERPVLVLTVVDSKNPDEVVTVEALSNHDHFSVGSRLKVLSPSRPRDEAEPVRAGVYIGRTAASTLRTQNTTFLHKDQVLVVRSIEGRR